MRYYVFPIFPLIIPLLFSVAEASPSLQNITIPLPNGTSNHGTPGLICIPTKWTDIVIFYLANYAAHAATTRTLPGEPSHRFAAVVIGALFFPAAGAYRGILGILGFAKSGKSDLEVAARAGALCMVVRGNTWKPQAGDSITNAIIRCAVPSGKSESEPASSPSVTPGIPLSDITQPIPQGSSSGTRMVIYNNPPWRYEGGIRGGNLNGSGLRIHGSYNLPDGYELSIVPSHATFKTPEHSNPTVLAYSYNAVKILVSLGQALYSKLRNRLHQNPLTKSGPHFCEPFR